MKSVITLKENYFQEKETVILKSGELSASLFIYDTCVKAVRLSNSRGNVVVLPFMGQMIWRAEFDGRQLAMKTIYEQPVAVSGAYCGTYGCFLMHCGLTAMGNPSSEDTHLPHGELPAAKYNNAEIILGEDEKGAYVGLTGLYTHKFCYEYDYEFSPMVKLYASKTHIDVEARLKNNKDIPLEYYYLCHINHRPVDGARLCYTANRETIKVYGDVPANHWDAEGAKLTFEYATKLCKNPKLMDNIGDEGQSYRPEIVFMARYSKDENGNAYTMQLNPDGTATYVIHKPEELPYGVRWISRTEDEDAIGMVLPATAEHLGKIYCRKNNQGKFLKKGEVVTYHMQTGLLDKDGADNMLKKIKSLGFN